MNLALIPNLLGSELIKEEGRKLFFIYYYLLA